MTLHVAGTNLVAILNVSLLLSNTYAQTNWQVASPNGQAVPTVRLAPAGGKGRRFYDVAHAGKPRAEGCTAQDHSP